jgi:hypothetical protein
MESSNGGPQSGIPLGKHFTGQTDEHKCNVAAYSLVMAKLSFRAFL